MKIVTCKFNLVFFFVFYFSISLLRNGAFANEPVFLPAYLPAIEQKLVFQKKIWDHGLPQQTLTLHVRRFVHEGAPVIILNHPIIMSNMVIRKLGYLYWKKGYDVWMANFRSHGLGKEKSTIQPYRRYDYHFSQLVAVDMPFICEEVMKRTQNRGPYYAIGYSMGAMIWESFLSGVTLNEGKIVIDKNLAQTRNRLFKKFIAIAPPEDFTELNTFMRLTLIPLRPLLETLHFFIPFSNNLTAGDQLHGLMGIVHRTCLNVIAKLIPILFPGGILSSDRTIYDPDEIFEMVKDLVSNPHTDLIGDFVRWFQVGYSTRGSNWSYAENRNITTPSLMFQANQDQIAVATRATLISRKSYPAQASLKFLIYKNIGHLDFVLGTAIHSVAKYSLMFLDDQLKFNEGVDELSVDPMLN
jgi:pimeloyl-ACP methyl ester carboxylesterase